jgi:hypothetical protein
VSYYPRDTNNRDDVTQVAEGLSQESAMCRLVFARIVLTLMAQGACADGAFSDGDRVWTTDILHMRDALGTALSGIGSMIKGSIGTVVDGPVFEGEYNWWNISYDAGTTGWSAENWLQKSQTEPQQPTDFAIWSENAIRWGETTLVQRIGRTKSISRDTAWALGEIGDAQAVDPLNYASVNDADGYVREEAKKALGKLGA